jgi:nitroreductase
MGGDNLGSVNECIRERRSIRFFKRKEVERKIVMDLLEAARWAPSAKNIQPWKFVVIMEDPLTRDRISSLSDSYRWLKLSPCLIAVFLDTQLQCDSVKDMQAIGAAIQNMLLAGHEAGLGMCWIGDILEKETEVREVLSVSEDYRLAAVIAAGYAGKMSPSAQRRDLKENILAWY